MGFSGCTKEYVTNYLPGVSYNVEVKSNTWTQITGTTAYEQVLDFPELDAKYFNYGHVGVAISFDNDPNYFVNIPSAVGDYNYRVEYAVGKVYVYADYVGTQTPAKPSDMLVKITLTDADDGGN